MYLPGCTITSVLTSLGVSTSSVRIANETLRTKYSQILTPSYTTVAILAQAITGKDSVAIGRL